MTFSAEVDEMVNKHISKSENAITGQPEFTCTLCHKAMKAKRHMINHVETHFEGMSHPCTLCGKIFKTRNSRDKHKYTYHKEKADNNETLPLYNMY